MGRIIELYGDQGEAIVRGAPGSFKPDFQIMTAGLWSDPMEQNLVHTVGSSTEQDLQGDFMSIEALNTMTKMPANLTAWLNHSYNLPDDIFGSIKGSPKILHQDGIADLHLDMDVEMDNPAAARVKKYIDNGRRLGTSIGCIVTKYEVPDESDGGDWFQQSIIIHGVRVLEFSIVGIPANQRSWVTNGIRGLFARTFDPALAPAMKSLWPRAYNELMEKAAHTLEPDVFKKILDAPTRAGTDAKLLWNAPERKFFVVQGKEEREVERGVLSDLLKTSTISLAKKSIVVAEVDLDTQEKSIEEVLRTEEASAPDVKTACGSTGFPLNTERSWDKGAAHGRLLEWAGGKDNFSPAKFKKVHFRYTGSGDKITDFHFPFCDIVDGKPEAIWHAVTAAAAALGGARGGADHEGDEGAMRSKIAHYYRKAGETPPWQDEDGEKGMDKDVTVKDGEEVIGFAINKDGTPGVIIKSNGTHDKTSGTHTHHHVSHGHGDVSMHHHEHTHSDDNEHHHDHAGMGDGEYCDDHDHDDTKAGDVETTVAVEEVEQKDADTPSTEAITPETVKDATPDVEAVSQPAELDAQQVAHLATLNTIGKLLGLPAITADHVQKSHLPVVKSGISHELVMTHAKAMHDHLFTLTNGACCSNEMSMEEAQADAAMAEGRDAAGGEVRSVEAAELLQKMADLTGALSVIDVLALRKDAEATGTKLATALAELRILQGEIAKAQETLANIKNMPLGNPVTHQRSVAPGSTVTREQLSQIKESTPNGDAEETLSVSLKKTEVRTTKMTNGQTISYRHWPAGVGKGCRPELTADQMTFMFHDDIVSYREGGAANVPLIDDPVA